MPRLQLPARLPFLLALLYLDLLLLLLTLLATLGLYLLPPHQRDARLFELVRAADGLLRGPPALSLPYRPAILSSRDAALVCVAVPLVAVAACQVVVRSWWDFWAGGRAVARALVAATFTQVILKQYIGGFRPHFLDVCRPDIGSALPAGFGGMYFNVTTCRGMSELSPKERERYITYALQSFPSGHTAAAFSVGVFLSLYLNAKLKAFADYSAEFWSFIVVMAPIIGASIIGGGLLVDNHHHPTDILFGALIGSLCALLAYRSSYASLLDYRYNHIPLPPNSSRTRFDYENLDLAAADSLVLSPWWSQRNSTHSTWRQEEGRLFDSVRKGRERAGVSPPAMRSMMMGVDGVVEGGGGGGGSGGGEARPMIVLPPVAVIDIPPGRQ